MQVIATRQTQGGTPLPGTTQRLQVEQEAKSDGRIDILLTDDRTKRALIVENKVRAIDQPRQLPRYYWDLLDKRGFKDITVVYLSLDGHQSTNATRYSKRTTERAL